MPIGLGSHTQWDEKTTGGSAALMSMPSIKAVEIGEGVAQTARRGSTVHDVITYDQESGWSHQINNAGGMEGGDQRRADRGAKPPSRSPRSSRRCGRSI